jgi:hypothetical protein
MFSRRNIQSLFLRIICLNRVDGQCCYVCFITLFFLRLCTPVSGDCNERWGKKPLFVRRKLYRPGESNRFYSMPNWCARISNRPRGGDSYNNLPAYTVYIPSKVDTCLIYQLFLAWPVYVLLHNTKSVWN